MYTSRPNARRRRLLRAAAGYLAISAFCGVFSAVYLHFSYGQSSPFLVWLFAPPLLFGAVPAYLLGRFAARAPRRTAIRFWNSAIASLTTGMLVRAVIDISGRYTRYDRIYWILAGALFFAAVLFGALQKSRKNECAGPVGRHEGLPGG